MDQIVDWLEKLGMPEYAQCFAENGIGIAALRHLTDQDLKEIGVLLRHRRTMLAAIAELTRAAEKVAQPVVGSEARPRDGAERRQVTVMFSDLVGSTALSARMDPEDLREVISVYQNCVAETVRRFDGFVAKYMGDGVLVYFGYPQAHEDDAEQAVRAGLTLVDAVGELRAAEPRQVRIGIATGLVVVGDLIGAGSAQEQAIVGETPNLAARLQALAEPNTVVIAESTCRQIGARFETEALGLQSLKGFANPQRVWRVISENRALSRFEVLRSGEVPLVGRDEELDLLLRRWEQAKAGAGQVVLISAEPGMGKSRLTEALWEKIAAEPHVRLRYFCSAHHQDSALYPLIVQMERAAGFARDDAPAAKLDKLQSMLASAAASAEDVALIAELHSLPSADVAPLLDLTPQRKKDKTFEALLRQVERFSRQQPMLMVFEDVHWVDPSSREFIDRAIERNANWPVLLLATFRPEFRPPWTGQQRWLRLFEQGHVTTLSLARLDRRNTATMVGNIAGDHTLPSDIVEEIAERADGVPLFVEELTKAVLEAGAQGPAALSSAPYPALLVPASLHASLMARLDRLGPAAKGIAQTGAVIGREFAYEHLALIADRPEPQLIEALDRLTNSGLLFVRGTAPQSSYIFKHALVQDAAYGTLLRSWRQQLHARIAVTFEDRFPEIVAAQPGLLARHCAEGGRAQHAVVYWLNAGRQAAARSAMAEAVAQLRKGLDVLAGLPDGPWRRQQELDLQIALGPALAGTKGFAADDVRETMARARALAEQIDRPEYLVPLMDGLWAFHFVRSEHKLALAVAEQIEKVGEARNDVGAQLLGRRSQGWTHSFLGEFIAARGLLERCHGLSDPAHRTFAAGLTFDPYASMLANLAMTLAYLGYIDQARSRMDEGLSEARRLKHASTLAYVLVWANWMESIICPSELQPRAEELQALSTEHGFPYWLGLATAFRGRSLVARGQAREGLTLLTQGLAALRATGAVTRTPTLLMSLAEAHAMLGHPGEGLNCLAEAAQIIEATEERLDEAELHRLHGNLLDATGDRSAAEWDYRQALGVAERQSAKLFELRAATSLARLWRDQGKRNDARELLAPIYRWFTEGFETGDLKEAKTLLDELT